MPITTTSVLNRSNTLKAREIDFVTRFATNWDLLRTVMGITRPIRKTPGTTLTYYVTKRVGDLQESPAEGVEITPTAYEVQKAGTYDLTIEKYRKTTSIEAVEKYGAAIAVQKTDEQFRNDLQMKVFGDYVGFLEKGTLTGSQKTFQRAVAIAQGAIRNKFLSINKTVTKIVGFVSIMDVFDYLGDAPITTQTVFGMQYLQNFLGFDTLFLLPDNLLTGKVIATPIENIDAYYIDPGDSEFAQLGLSYTTSGETNLIGYHVEGNYKNATGDVFALMGLKLWAEFIDGIAVITINPNVDNAKPAVAEGAQTGLSDGSPKA